MNELELEYRMYGLVPYNISPIQQGIQFGHAVVEYGLDIIKAPLKLYQKYDKWARIDKTFIIYNGKTTNENVLRPGTMQQYAAELKANGIFTAEFREPDLNDTLTAVVFLVDERVFNKEKYPDYETYFNEENVPAYDMWVKEIGGETNVFLRKFLPQFRMA